MRLRPIHPMLTEVIQAALLVCDQTEYFTEGRCNSCGGALSGYDTRSKRFATINDGHGDHPIEVILHRSYCKQCGKIWMPEEPFYIGTRIGSPVVDLCQTLTVSLSSGQVAALIERMGVKVDRWSVRSYCHLPIPPPPTMEAFGMNLPVSIISLSTLTTDEGKAGHIRGEDVLEACHYPSRRRSIL